MIEASERTQTLIRINAGSGQAHQKALKSKDNIAAIKNAGARIAVPQAQAGALGWLVTTLP